MSKAKMQAAKALIDEKEYDQARTILKTVDHPTAKAWLAKLDKIAPQKPRRSTARKVIVWVALLASLAAGAVLIMKLQADAAVSGAAMRQALDDRGIVIGYRVYCTSDLGLDEATCITWSETTWNTHQSAVRTCNAFDWIRETDLFEACLSREGIPLP